MAEIDLKDLRRSEAYGLLISFIVPRAIALTSTKDARGHTNVAPFSFFTGLGSDPPMVTLGISNRRDGREKDTLRIARETGVLCINLVEEALAEKMNLASADYEPEVSEFEPSGLTAAPCAVIDGVRVREARAALECRLVDVHTYGRAAKTNLVVAEVLHAFIADEILGPDGRSVDIESIAPLGRLGGAHYAKLGELFAMPRPRL